MLFLAQINFADVPPMPDFPDKGLLQLLVEVDAHGHIGNVEDPACRVIRWIPKPSGQEILAVPQTVHAMKKNGSLSLRAMTNGLSLAFRASHAAGHPFNWPFSEIEPDTHGRLGETPDVQEQMDNWYEDADARLGVIQNDFVGGHPIFNQDDIRCEPQHQHLDRVLLHLGYGEDVNLGDSGNLNLMINQQDLRDRNFAKAFCTWDRC